MAQEMVGNIPKLEWLFNQVLLKVKVVKIGKDKYCVHHLNDLRDIEPSIPFESKGVLEFHAKSEIHFVPKNGISYSDGKRYNIKGTVEWKDNNWALVDTLILEDKVIFLNILKKEEDEQSVI